MLPFCAQNIYDGGSPLISSSTKFNCKAQQMNFGFWEQESYDQQQKNLRVEQKY